MRTDYDSGAPAMARGAVVNLAATIAATVLGLLFNFVVTHVVSVGSIGILALGTTVVSLAILFEVPGATAIAAVWLHQHPPWAALPGLLVLLVGVGIVIAARSRTDPPSVPVE